MLTKILDSWRAKAKSCGFAIDNVTLPVSVKMIVADSDKQAFDMGRRFYPPYFELQADHYEVDSDPWSEIEEYQAFSRMFANLRKLANPDALGPFMEANLVGSPETVCTAGLKGWPASASTTSCVLPRHLAHHRMHGMKLWRALPKK